MVHLCTRFSFSICNKFSIEPLWSYGCIINNALTESRVPLWKRYFCDKVKPRDLLFFYLQLQIFFYRFPGLRWLIAPRYWHQYEEDLKCILSRYFTGCKRHPHRLLLNTFLPPTFTFIFMASSSILFHLFTPTSWNKWQHIVDPHSLLIQFPFFVTQRYDFSAPNSPNPVQIIPPLLLLIESGSNGECQHTASGAQDITEEKITN